MTEGFWKTRVMVMAFPTQIQEVNSATKSCANPPMDLLQKAALLAPRLAEA